MKNSRIILLTAFIISLTGCVTGYQSYTWSGGYKDEDLGDGKFRVEYYGNGSTPPELVLERWHTRSKELCPYGYDVISSNTGEDSGTTSASAGGAFIPISFSHPFVKGEIKCKQN